MPVQTAVWADVMRGSCKEHSGPGREAVRASTSPGSWKSGRHDLKTRAEKALPAQQ